jgi:hypothetical protein
MRRTDFCHLTSSYEHPRLVGFRPHHELSLARDRRIACHHVRAIRFGGPHVFALWLRRGGRCLPLATRVGRASGTPVAAFGRSMPLARARSVVEAAEAERQTPRVMRGRVDGTARGAFHRSRALAPRRPFGRPARASFRGCGLAAARTGGRCPSPARAAPRRTTHARAGPPSTRPVASGSHASLGPGPRLPTSATSHDARAHPTSVRSSHASGAFGSAARRHQPMPVASAAALRRRIAGPASHGLHATAFARRVPLAWTWQTAGRSARAKAYARGSGESCACPPRDASGTRVAGRQRASGPWRSRRSCAPAEIHPRTAPRERRRRRRDRGAFCRDETLTREGWFLRARLDRGPVTPPPQRHCSRARAPFGPPRTACP